MCFLYLCQEKNQLDDPAVFNSIWPELAHEVSDKLRKEFTLEEVRAKIHMFRTHFSIFLSFCQCPGVLLCRRWGRVNVTTEYYDHIGEERDIQRNFPTDGFLLFLYCNNIFIRGRLRTSTSTRMRLNIFQEPTQSTQWSSIMMTPARRWITRVWRLLVPGTP